MFVLLLLLLCALNDQLSVLEPCLRLWADIEEYYFPTRWAVEGTVVDDIIWQSAQVLPHSHAELSAEAPLLHRRLEASDSSLKSVECSPVPAR